MNAFRKLLVGGVCLAMLSGQALAQTAPQSAPTNPGAIFDSQRGVLTFQPQIGASLSSVVRIVTLAPAKPDEAGKGGEPAAPAGQLQIKGYGSGVIFDAAQGLVLTNNHVVEPGTAYRVEFLNGRSAEATLVGRDPATDVAVLKVTTRNLRQIELADSDAIQVGDVSFAVGYPLGLEQTVTMGIVSAVGRQGQGQGQGQRPSEGIEDYIQTDAAINSGNSGGPLLDSRGRLVGLNTAILSRGNGGNIGIGFVVPTRMAMAIAAQLQKYGEVRRGALGVSVGRLTQEQADAAGLEDARAAYIAGVDAGSAAARAGLRAGDIVVAVNGRPVRSDASLRAAIGVAEIGSKVRIDYIRGRQRASTEVTLAAPSTTVAAGPSGPSGSSAPSQRAAIGMTLRDIRQGDRFPPEARGAVVDQVIDGSPAGQTGLQSGDLIVAVGEQAVANAAAARSAIQATRGPIRLVVARGNSLHAVTIGS